MLPPPTSALPPTSKSLVLTAPRTETFPPTSTEPASRSSATSTIPPTLTGPTQETEPAYIFPPTSILWALILPSTLRVWATSASLLTTRFPVDLSVPRSTVRESHSKSQSTSALLSK